MTLQLSKECVQSHVFAWFYSFILLLHHYLVIFNVTYILMSIITAFNYQLANLGVTELIELGLFFLHKNCYIDYTSTVFKDKEWLKFRNYVTWNFW